MDGWGVHGTWDTETWVGIHGVDTFRYMGPSVWIAIVVEASSCLGELFSADKRRLVCRLIALILDFFGNSNPLSLPMPLDVSHPIIHSLSIFQRVGISSTIITLNLTCLPDICMAMNA